LAEQLQIRPATVSDAATIAAFNVAMAAETEGLALDPDTVAAGVLGLLTHPERGFYLVAEDDGVVVGQLMCTFEWSDWRNGVQYWIQSVYVMPSARRRGVYRALYEALVGRANDAGAAGVRLYVHHDNVVAQQTYSALGMDAAEYRIFEVDFVLAR
jgi:ribosomal protein S18 acetylase RimI-like enzyme